MQLSVKQSTSRGLYKSFNLKQKLEVLECVKSGMNYKKILEKFNITKSTFYDKTKNKDKLKSFVESETKSNKNIIRLKLSQTLKKLTVPFTLGIVRRDPVVFLFVELKFKLLPYVLHRPLENPISKLAVVGYHDLERDMVF